MVKIKILSTHNVLRQKFAAVFGKIFVVSTFLAHDDAGLKCGPLTISVSPLPRSHESYTRLMTSNKPPKGFLFYIYLTNVILSIRLLTVAVIGLRRTTHNNYVATLLAYCQSVTAVAT